LGAATTPHLEPTLQLDYKVIVLTTKSSKPSLPRLLGFATLGASVLAALALTACGGDDPATAQTTIAIRPTAYVTLPVVTTLRPTSTTPGQEAATDREATGEGEVYRVRRGDALPLIADRYDITVEELVEFNDWEEGALHPIYPGDEVRIPSFADEPTSDGTITDERPDDGLGTMPAPGGGPLCPDGTERDTYEIVSGDFISRVAEKNDLTNEELEAANVDNPAWRVFAPGQDLWLPCEGEELDVPESSGG
jgi:LysM repeat protein